MATFGSLFWSVLFLVPSDPSASTLTPEQERKLDTGLAERIAAASAGEFLPVDVILAEQADKGLIDSAVAAPDKRGRREQVVALLRDTATRSQAPLMEFLAREREAGGVRGEIESLWIHNVVSAEVAPRVALALAARSDVALVHLDPPRGEEVLVAAPPAPTAGGNPTCGLDLIGAPEVWSQFGILGQGVVVGVIDSGLCATHLDIAGQVWTNPGEIADNGIDDDQNGFIDDTRGWNFMDDSNDTNDDPYGHGSHVSGTVAGDGTGGNQCGVAPDARIMVLKIITSSTGEQAVWSAMQYGVDNGADVLNGSLGWFHGIHPERATWRAVCDNSIAAGLVLCFAAGNEGCSTRYDSVRTPGDVPAVITVGAVNCSDVLAGYSSCGPVTWQDVPPYSDYPYPPGLEKPDVCASGLALSHRVCAGYAVGDGTSMATPHVAGLAALLLQSDPMLDHFGVKRILETTAVDLGEAGKDNHYGWGRIDALAAVQAALANGNYCFAKQSSCSTTPSISSTGVPSATATSGFVVTASGMRAHEFGMLMYTASGPNDAPFLGGHLCIQGIHRTVLADDTVGTLGFCDGVLSIDMNSFRAGLLGGPPPLAALSLPGSTIHCQFYGHDPGNSFDTLLTAVLKFTVCP